MFQENQGSDFLNLKIDAKIYTNGILDYEKNNLNVIYNKERKNIKYKDNASEIIISFLKNPIIKKEDNQKKIIINNNKINIYITSLQKNIFMNIINYNYKLDKNKLNINYYIKESEEQKTILIIFREEYKNEK